MDRNARTLYCGNLSDKVTEKLLYELFLQAGPLESVKMPKDRDGRKRNYAFITFKHEVSVPYTLALMQGISLFGRPLRLDTRGGLEPEYNPYLGAMKAHERSQSAYSCPGMDMVSPNQHLKSPVFRGQISHLRNAMPSPISSNQGYQYRNSPESRNMDQWNNGSVPNYYPMDVSRTPNLNDKAGMYPMEPNLNSRHSTNFSPVYTRVQLHLLKRQQEQDFRRASVDGSEYNRNNYNKRKNTSYGPHWKQRRN